MRMDSCSELFLQVFDFQYFQTKRMPFSCTYNAWKKSKIWLEFKTKDTVSPQAAWSHLHDRYNEGAS